MFLFTLLHAGCKGPEAGQKSSRIFYINSYHRGYPASDEVTEAIREGIEKHQMEWRVFYLDSKNDPDSSHVNIRVNEARKQIDQYRPDVIIASDDAAVKYLVVPWLKNGKTPVVFCGVNWSAGQYGLPASNVTGMLEVLPLRETLETMKRYYPGARKLVVLSEASLSEERNRELLDTLYRGEGFEVKYEMVADFSDWKKAFLTANEWADIIYLPTNGAITGWDREEAMAFVQEHIRKPVITCDDFMMPYCVFGLTKVASEQGNWAIQAAWDIIGGRTANDIPMTSNKQSRSFFNKRLARVIRFDPDQSLINSSVLIE